jgi:hypothetical protein
MHAITIRTAYADDATAVARLAALDSAPVPTGRLLAAEVDGELRAVLSLATGAVIADPFAPTADLVALLRLQAERERQEPTRSARRLLRWPSAGGGALRPARA